MLKNNTYVSEGGPIQTYQSTFIKNTSGKKFFRFNELPPYNELFSGSLQSSLYQDSTVCTNSKTTYQQIQRL